ncbi:MAG: glycosyltransferase family 4 protein [Candidatus Cloacimonetes bacterium]|nr:glycosyltransferase family 4 protein [Candidatus Cloacimonadota bacterium]
MKKIKVFFIDANNNAPNTNYPLIESLQSFPNIEINFFSVLYSKSTNYYNKNYDVITNCLFFNFVSRINKPSLRRLVKIFSHPIANFRLLCKVMNEKPDIIHYSWIAVPFVDYFFIKIFKMFSIKIVITQHNYLQHNKLRLRLLENRIFQIADKIICLSDFIKSQFPEIIFYKISVIEHGNSYEKEKEYCSKKIIRKKDSNFKILFLGNIRPYKGIEMLLDSMSYIVNGQKMDNIQLRIAGKCKPDYCEKIMNIIKANNLINYVKFEGKFLDYDKLFEYVINTDIGVLPYLEATQSGLPYIFASLHKPMVITNVGGLPEQVSTEFSEIVEPAFIEVANGIFRIKEKIEDKKIKESDFESYLEKHRWKDTVYKYVNLYQDLLAK